MGETITFENDRIRVCHVTHKAQEQHPPVSRNDRLIIYLRDGHITRVENGKPETFQHRAGHVVWRNASQHQITNLKDEDHDVIMVELKDYDPKP
jgi:hypothetical protein